MKQTPRFITPSFALARDNMAFDDTLVLNQVGQITPVFRVYEWQTPSITYTKNKSIPDDLSSYDYAPRLSGGGIVFHCPGDIVFCICIPHDHADFPKTVKDKISFVSSKLSAALETCGVTTMASPKITNDQDIQFCNSYHNPYERYQNGEKIVAIALKKTKNHVVMQGVIHVQDTADYFGALSDKYTAYFTRGIITKSLETRGLITAIRKQFFG